jgi:predicted phosphohydrolase
MPFRNYKMKFKLNTGDEEKMVLFQIASDLHIETFNEVDPLTLIQPTADILILAGDIGRVNKHVQLKGFLTKVCKEFKEVLYVLGNHEYYRTPGYQTLNMSEVIRRLTELEIAIPNLHILNRSSVVIDDVCIAGCTLWTEPKCDVPQFIVKIDGMNRDTYTRMHRQDLSYIRQMIGYSKRVNKKLLVVTHHPPTSIRDGPGNNNDRFVSLYENDLDYLLDSDNIHTWVFGHVHLNRDYITPGGTRLVSNQRGKSRDCVASYDPKFVINV